MKCTVACRNLKILMKFMQIGTPNSAVSVHSFVTQLIHDLLPNEEEPSCVITYSEVTFG